MVRTADLQNAAHSGEAPRVMAYCHDGVGLGHLRRTLTICEHVGKLYPQCSFLVATGTPYFPLFRQPPRVDCLKLPALAKRADGSYYSKYMNIPFERLRNCRVSLLLQAVQSYEPDVLLVDKAPVGVCGELLPTLEWLRRHRPDTRIVFGMRDIEDDPDATIRQWTRLGAQRVIEECFDEVWVYGMRCVFDVAAEYCFPRPVRRKLSYTGYVTREPCRHPVRTSSDQRTVLVTVGGGTDGERVLTTYLASAARQIAEAGAVSILVGGPDLPRAAAERLRQAAGRTPGTRWLDYESCMSCRIRESDLIVSMGGYNTMCELAQQRKPALIIPRTKPRLEQTIRARLWEKLGAVSALPGEELNPDVLAERVVQMLGKGTRSTTPRVDMQGLDRIAARFGAFWAEERGSATAVRV